MVARLNQLWSAFNISSSNDSSSSNESHGKASLVKIVDIIVENAIFDDCILHANEPLMDELQVFHLSSLAVISSRESSLDLIMALDEAVDPVLADNSRL